MSVRKAIQVPEELKSSVEGYKDEFRAKTEYEVIERLVQSHESNKEYRESIRLKRIEEADRIKSEYIHTGKDVKKMLGDFCEEMKITEAQALDMLLCHFNEQPNIGHITFGLYRSFK